MLVGAFDGTRTRDLVFTKDVLYLLSYKGTHVPKDDCGGPGWIRTSEGVRQRSYSPPHLATLEPTHNVSWSRRSESNRQPTVYKTVALPIELRRRSKRTVVDSEGKYTTLMQACQTQV